MEITKVPPTLEFLGFLSIPQIVLCFFFHLYRWIKGLTTRKPCPLSKHFCQDFPDIAKHDSEATQAIILSLGKPLVLPVRLEKV
jgi:hypothetical protein